MRAQTARNQPSRMEKLIDFLCRLSIHRRNLAEFFLTRHPDLLDGFEIFHQCFSPGRSDPLDIIQDRMYLSLATKQAVIFDGIQPQPLGGKIDRWADRKSVV